MSTYEYEKARDISRPADADHPAPRVIFATAEGAIVEAEFGGFPDVLSAMRAAWAAYEAAEADADADIDEA